jgi:hypothetical protein
LVLVLRAKESLMPRIKHIFPTHYFCHDCKVVVPIVMTPEAAAETAKHVGHSCEYTRVTP